MLRVLQEEARPGRRCVSARARHTDGPPRAVQECCRDRRRAGAILAAGACIGACLGALGLAPTRLRAQDATGPFAGIAVSDSQRVALRAVGARTQAAAAPLVGRLQRATPADSVTARATRDSLNAIYTAHNAALRQLLTADQRATFDANMAAFAAAHRAAAQARDRERMRQAPAPSTSAAAAGGRP